MTLRPFSILKRCRITFASSGLILCSLLVVFSFSSVSVAQEYYANDDYWIIDFRTPTVFGVAHNDRPVGAGGFTIVTPPTNGNAFWHDFHGSLAYSPSSTTSIYSDTVTYKNCLPVSGQMVCTNTATVTILVIGTNEDSQNLGSCPMLKKPYAQNSVGQPVNVTNGNMWLEQSDYSLPGIGESIEINRFYNSRVQSSGIFGFGWSTKYDELLAVYDDKMIRLDLPDAKGIFFGRPNINAPFTSVSPDFTGKIIKEQDNSYTLTYQDGRIRKFNTGGRLLWQRDRNGNQTTLNYDINNLLTGVTDSTGRTLTLVPNPNGTISQINDALGLIADYEYVPGTTQLKTVTYADGSKYKFEYTDININGQTKTFLTTVKDALDNILETYLYDLQGRATTSEKHGGVEKYTLSYTNSELTTVTDALGRTTKYRFIRRAGNNLVTSVEGVCGGCGGSGSETTSFQYNNNSNLFLKTDALGRQTTYEYYPDGNLKKQIDVLGTQEFTYNIFGEVLTSKDRMNGIWTNTYDANGNLKTTKDPLNNTTTIEYPAVNNKGLPNSVKDARINITKFKWFAASGLLEEVEDPYTKKTKFTYDGRGRIKTSTDALNHVTSYNYFTPAERNIEITYPNSDKVRFHFLERRLLETKTDERGKITSYVFDAAYRLKKITDPLLHVKEILKYDLMSNVEQYKDPLGFITDYKYDNFNRLKEVEYPAASAGATRLKETFEYDKLGRILKHYDSANRLTTYGYDDAARTNTVTNAELETTTTIYNRRFQTIEVKDALNQIYTFGYDALGRVTSQTRAGGTMSFAYDDALNRRKRTDYAGRVTDYTYDKLNRLTKIEYDGGAVNPTPNLQSVYGYDDISRLTSATNESGTVAFTYDSRNRTKTTTDVFGHVIEYEYELSPAVNQKRLKFDGAMHAIYNFDDAGRLANLVNSSDSSTITFGYDDEDKIKSRIYPNGVTTSYEYDDMDRLKRLKDISPTATLFDRQYGYNSANQIETITEPANTRTFGYDLTDRLQTVTASNNQNENYLFDDVGNRTSSHKSSTYGYQPFNKLKSTQTGTYAHDANGNTVNKSEGKNFWRYTWDYENRMTAASARKQTVRYRYDALGRRVQRYIPGGKENTKFIHDGQDVLADDNAGTLTKYQNGPGIDNKLRVQTGNTANYFLSDHLGSTNGLADSSGALTSQTAYDSFGSQTANLSTRYGFTGRETDDFTGLMYYRARFYDPNLGRFISEDPIGFKGGDVNLYGYVKNRPLKYRDPRGLDDADREYRDTDEYKDLERRGNDFWNKRRKSCECTNTPYQNSFPGTFQIGLGGSGVLGVLPVTGGVGLAFDTSGNVGAYYDVGTGAGIGANVTGGLQLTGTNASTMNALNGAFVNPTIALGDGLAGSGSLVYGLEDSGPILGASVLLGGGGGASYSVTATNTTVVPLFSIPDLYGGQRPCKKN